jgi:hypothetical protein
MGGMGDDTGSRGPAVLYSGKQGQQRTAPTTVLVATKQRKQRK